ncbi:hypothetical protein RJD39_04670 [Vibrio scophthalmi]|uniref:hypothetical protein n=1 Tax=Vibrio scophthalmi TaxID=45658 RepID=UPI003872F2FE
MNVVIHKYQQLEQSLSDYLAELNQNPPFGLGSFLKPLNQSFQLIRILGNQMKAQEQRLAELEKQLASLASNSSKEADNHE